MKKVIIIGAGPAGLTAGYDLLSKSSDYDVTIVEETSVVGGLCARFETDGNVLDSGGHMFVSNNSSVKKFWNSILPAQGVPSKDDIALDRYCKIHNGGPNPETDEDVILSREKVTRIYKDNKFYENPVKLNNKEAVKNLGFATSIKSGFSQLGGNVFKHKEASLEDYYINRYGKQIYSMFLEEYIEKIWGKKPSRMGSEWGPISEKSLIAPVISSEKGNKDYDRLPAPYAARYYYPKNGAYQMWENTADRFIEMGGSIHKNCKVTGITVGQNKVTSVKCCADGDEFVVACDYLISSMPIRDLILGMDNVEGSMKLAAENLAYRGMVSIFVELSEMNWKNDNKEYKTAKDMIPDSVVFITSPNVKVSRIEIFNNFSPYMIKNEDHFYLGLNYYCNEGDYYWSMSDRDWKQAVVNDLVKLGIITGEESILSFGKTKYNKAFPAYYDGYENINTLVKFLNGFGNLYCIGRNGQHRFSAIDEVMRTSFEAVNNIIGNVTSKDNVWTVNDKKDSDESKAYNSALLSGEGEYRGNYVPLQKKIEDNPDEKRDVVQPRRLRRPMMTPIKKADPEGKLSEPIILDNSVVIAARPDKTIPIEETVSEEQPAVQPVAQDVFIAKPGSSLYKKPELFENTETVTEDIPTAVANENLESAEDAENAAVIDVKEGNINETSGNENDVLIFEPVDKYAELLKDNDEEVNIPEQVEETNEVSEETIAEEVAEEPVVEETVAEEPVVEETVAEDTVETAEETIEETTEFVEEPVSEETTEFAEEFVTEESAEFTEEAATLETTDFAEETAIEETIETAETEEETTEAVEEVTEEIEETSEEVEAAEEAIDEFADAAEKYEDEILEVADEETEEVAEEVTEEAEETVEEETSDETAETEAEQEEVTESKPISKEDEFELYMAALEKSFEDSGDVVDISFDMSALDEEKEKEAEAEADAEAQAEETQTETIEAEENVEEEIAESEVVDEIAESEVVEEVVESEVAEEASFEETAESEETFETEETAETEGTAETEETEEATFEEAAVTEDVVEETAFEETVETEESEETAFEETAEEVAEETSFEEAAIEETIEESVPEEIANEEIASAETVPEEIATEEIAEVNAEADENKSELSGVTDTDELKEKYGIEIKKSGSRKHRFNFNLMDAEEEKPKKAPAENKEETANEIDSFSLPGGRRSMFSRKALSKENKNNKGNKNNNSEIELNADNTQNAEINQNNENTENTEKKALSFGRTTNFTPNKDKKGLSEAEAVIPREQICGEEGAERVKFSKTEKFKTENYNEAPNPHERFIRKEDIEENLKKDYSIYNIKPSDTIIAKPMTTLQVDNKFEDIEEEVKEEKTEAAEVIENTNEAVEAVVEENVAEEVTENVNEEVVSEEIEAVEEAVEETEAETTEFEEAAEETEAETTEFEESAEETVGNETAETEETVEEAENIAEAEAAEFEVVTEESDNNEEAVAEVETAEFEETSEETLETESAEFEEAAEEVEETEAAEFEEVTEETNEDEFEAAAEEIEEAEAEEFEEVTEESEEAEAEEIEEETEEVEETEAEEIDEETEEVEETEAEEFDEVIDEEAEAEEIDEETDEVEETESEVAIEETSEPEEEDSLKGINEQAASRAIVKTWQNKYHGTDGSALSSENISKKSDDDRILRTGSSAALYGDAFALSSVGRKGAMDHVLDDLDGGKEYVTHNTYNPSSSSKVKFGNDEEVSNNGGGFQIIKESGSRYDFSGDKDHPLGYDQSIDDVNSWDYGLPRVKEKKCYSIKNEKTNHIDEKYTSVVKEYNSGIVKEERPMLGSQPVTESKPVLESNPVTEEKVISESKPVFDNNDYFKKEIDTSIVFKNARVIKTTKITRGIDENVEVKKETVPEKKEKVYSDKERVIAVIKNGEVIPVSEKTEQKAASGASDNKSNNNKKNKKKKNRNKRSSEDTSEEIIQAPISVMLDADEAAEMAEPLESLKKRKRGVKY